MLILSFLLMLVVHLSNGANILIYNPMIGQSHIRFMGNIADILSRAGHNLTVLSVEIDPRLRPFGTTENNIHKIHITMSKDENVFKELHDNINNVWMDEEMKAFDPEEFDVFFNPILDGYRVILENKTLIDSMKNTKFDLAIHEFYEVGPSALMETFEISKTILASAIGDVAPYTYQITGVPFMPSFVPGWTTIYDDKMNLWQRFNNMMKFWEIKGILDKMHDRVLNLFHAHYPEIVDVNQILRKKSGLILANVNEFTQTPRPVSSMIQFIGGSSLYPTKPLEKEFDELLNMRKHNVIFSLGSFVRFCEAPLKIKKLFAQAFASMEDVTFIVKYENCSNDEFDFNKYDNIVSKAWLPQTDLLGDDRVNAFITHGGMNSITEGQYRGKPMITIPIFGDQILNSKNAARVGSAIMIDRRFITNDLLVESLESLLNSQSSFVDKAKFIAKCLDGREEEYRQRIVKWVELQSGVDEPFDHLAMHSRNLSVLELYNLDILGIVLGILLFFIMIIFFVFRLVLITLFNTEEKKKKN
ncbi:unnamed protein product [Auanema sp. JU1783]|nr:unnamed protein product [Auanema sp. JU1783]